MDLKHIRNGTKETIKISNMERRKVKYLTKKRDRMAWMNDIKGGKILRYGL